MQVPLPPATARPSSRRTGWRCGSPLLGNLSHALACWRTHPPSHINFERLAVTTHCSAPSSPLVGGTGRVGEASSLLAEGGAASTLELAASAAPAPSPTPSPMGPVGSGHGVDSLWAGSHCAQSAGHCAWQQGLHPDQGLPPLLLQLPQRRPGLPRLRPPVSCGRARGAAPRAPAARWRAGPLLGPCPPPAQTQPIPPATAPPPVAISRLPQPGAAPKARTGTGLQTRLGPPCLGCQATQHLGAGRASSRQRH